MFASPFKIEARQDCPVSHDLTPRYTIQSLHATNMACHTINTYSTVNNKTLLTCQWIPRLKIKIKNKK